MRDNRMLTPEALFWKRVRSEWAFQYQVFRSVVDWTVAAYIAVPLLLFCVYQYITWWSEPPVWLTHIPLAWMIALPSLAVMTGGIRFFLHEADVLFLTQKKRWIRALMTRGTVYSVCGSLASSVAAAVVAAPLFHIGYDVEWPTFVCWMLLLFALHLQYMAAASWIRILFDHWRRWVTLMVSAGCVCVIFTTVAYFFTHPAAVLLVSAAILALAAALMRSRLTLEGAFLKDADYDKRRKFRFASAIYSGYAQEKKRTGLQPLFFRQSRRLFRKAGPAHAFAELGIKSFIRQRRPALTYIQLMVLGIFAITEAASAPVKIPLWLAFGASIAGWLLLQMKGLEQSEFARIFPMQAETTVSGARKAVFILLIPGYMILSVCTAIQLYSGLQLAFFLLGSFGCCWITATALTRFVYPFLRKS